MEALFRRTFGRAPAVIASAPGRVNLIGEHTDYNGGLVLPVAIPQRTTVAVARRADRMVAVHTAFGAQGTAYALGEETRLGDCFDYVRGVTWAAAEAGLAIPGIDVAIESTVPAGSGLSSSAALEVALLRAVRELADLSLDDVALARVAHRAESAFVGARVGLLDQMAASLADTTTALFLDTRTLAFERVALGPAVELVVVDSGVRHRIVDGGYGQRREECERAAAMLGVEVLCGLDEAALERIARLPAPLDRRARHVVTEHRRVVAAVAALRVGDIERLGRLFLASHASQRDDFQVSVPEVDCLVDLAWDDPDVHGARLTGGGFGGAIVALVRPGTGGAVAQRVAGGYRRAMQRDATVIVPITT